MRNFDRKWGITCRYRSRDQNCNFRKFKMANGRHFENALSPYDSCELSDFDQIWYADADFHSEDGLLTQKNWNFANSRWRTDDILKIVLAISRRHIGRLMRNLGRKWRITCLYRSRDQNCNFRKFKMADGRNLKIALSPYHSCELSDFD